MFGLLDDRRHGLTALFHETSGNAAGAIIFVMELCVEIAVQEIGSRSNSAVRQVGPCSRSTMDGSWRPPKVLSTSPIYETRSKDRD
jgi:hypothetical protein